MSWKTLQNCVVPFSIAAIREWNSRGNFSTTSCALSRPKKAHGSNQWS